jgi:hypothetical protein
MLAFQVSANNGPEQMQQNRENSINQRAGAREQRRGHGEAERVARRQLLPHKQSCLTSD